MKYNYIDQANKFSPVDPGHSSALLHVNVAFTREKRNCQHSADYM